MQKSSCASHNAVNMAESKSLKGLAATGLGTIDCARHNMKLPNGVGDLQKGERYVLFRCSRFRITDLPTSDILIWIFCSFRPYATALWKFSTYHTISRANGTNISGLEWRHFQKITALITLPKTSASLSLSSTFPCISQNVRHLFLSTGLVGLGALMARLQSADGLISTLWHLV